MTDLLSGRVHARCIGIPEGDTVRTMPTIRALAVTKAERSPMWPGVPTMAETVPGFVGAGYFGIVAPARTPDEIIARINGALNDALKDDKLRAGYDRVGADIAPPNTPAEFRALTRADAAKWGPLIRRLNLIAE
jgi:tripartite-type tricarboxylate transporter receptor subunit TctC